MNTVKNTESRNRGFAVKAPETAKRRPFVSKQGLAVAVAGAVMTAEPAFAYESAGQLSQQFANQFRNFGSVLVNACFLVGVGVAGSGLLELKRASDDNNQGRDSHKSGAMKILAGGGLAAVGPITGTGIGTIFSGGQGDNLNAAQALNFQS